jgi:tetratricopeptide (TPR) repeat protein
MEKVKRAGAAKRAGEAKWLEAAEQGRQAKLLQIGRTNDDVRLVERPTEQEKSVNSVGLSASSQTSNKSSSLIDRIIPKCLVSVVVFGAICTTTWASYDGWGIDLLPDNFLPKKQAWSKPLYDIPDALAQHFFNRGYEKGVKGETIASIVEYDRAIKLKPNYAYAFNNRGIALFALGKKTKAITDYNRAISLNPFYAHAFYNRGLANKALAKKKEAIADFQKASELYQQQGNDKGRQDTLSQLETLKPPEADPSFADLLEAYRKAPGIKLQGESSNRDCKLVCVKGQNKI